MTAPLIDADRYPLADLNAPQGQRAVAAARAQLLDRGAAELEGFLSTEALVALAEDADRLVPLAHWSEGFSSAYLDPSDRDPNPDREPYAPPEPGLPAPDPRSWQGRHRLGVVAYDLIPYASPLRRLHEWEPLRRFVAAVLGIEIYPYGDPLGALNVAVMRDGDELQWHFDQTDFVVSLALRLACSGGAFEFVPGVRSDEEQVAGVLAGRRDMVQVLAMTPGSLVLFQGRESLHRVSRVEGSGARIVALLAYDTRPGRIGTPALRRERYGRTMPMTRPPTDADRARPIGEDARRAGDYQAT